MPADPVTLPVPMPADRWAALDALARAQHADHAALVNEAVAQYLAEQAGWAAHLATGLRQAEAGDLAEEAAMAAAFAPHSQPA